jgi:MFS family permease
MHPSFSWAFWVLIPGAQLAGRAVHSYSSKLVVRIAGAFLPVGVFVIGIADTVQILLLGLFITGFNVAFMDIAINGQAVEIEKHTKGRWMSSFHGFWSIGAFAATLVGGLIANFVSPQDNLIAIAAIGLFAFQFIASYMLPAEHDGHLGEPGKDDAGKVKLIGKESLILWALGIGLMCSLIPEGGAYEWSGILLQDHMGIGKGLNAAAATTFSLAMIASRLLGDRAFEKWGHVNTVKYGGYVGGSLWGIGLFTGMYISDSHPTAGLILVCLGFGAAGFGMGPFFPAFNLAAASIPGIAPSVGLARVGLIAIAAYFGGPTIIGLIAEVTSLPVAFAFPVVLYMIVGLQSKYIKVREIKQ